MAARAFGLLLSANVTEARYDYGLTEDDPERGVLVIPVEDPAAWWVEGVNAHPVFAGSVAGKAVTAFQRTGEWPANASIHTG